MTPGWFWFRKLFMAHASFAIVKYSGSIFLLSNCSSSDGRKSGGRENATQTTDEHDFSRSVDPSRIDERTEK